MDSLDISPDEVHRRFRWARRQGHPAWLWPEVPIPAWREALHRIEGAVGDVLLARSNAEPLAGDPAAIGLACYTSGVGPLLGWWQENDLLAATREVAPVLELHLRHNRIRAPRMRAAAALLVETLLARNVAVTVLKGAHTEHVYFPSSDTRPASDIDLLVHERDAASAEGALLSLGYVGAGRGPRESSWRHSAAPREPRSLRLVHADDPWSIDLHSSLNLSAGPGAPVARLDAADPMSSRSRWPPSPGAAVLDQPLLLLHLAVHAGTGLQNLTLLRLVELIFVIRRDMTLTGGTWEAFLALGKRTDALGFAYPPLRLCEDLAPATVPHFVLERCAAEAPPAVRAVVGRLTPATAQRVHRGSLAEHFMWTRGWRGRLEQLASDLVPSTSARTLWSVYERRIWALVRGRISR
ncbi:MAG: nucleotidyltransferase family protein [Sphingomonadales bacterium]